MKKEEEGWQPPPWWLKKKIDGFWPLGVVWSSLGRRKFEGLPIGGPPPDRMGWGG